MVVQAVMTRAEGRELADAVVGAVVQDARVEAGVLILELRHYDAPICGQPQDDDAKRVAVSLSAVVADDWPWPEPAHC